MNRPRYTVSLYSGDQQPAVHPIEEASAATEREARKIAARMLGHKSLRGASTWERYQGGTVYQFGPRTEGNGYEHAVIEEIA